MLVNFLLLGSLFIGLSYKCNLQAVLVTQKVKIPFRNMEEMVNQRNVKWAIPAENPLEIMAKNSLKGSVFRRVYDEASYNIDDPQKIVEGLNERKFALLVPELIGFGLVVNRFRMNNRCTLTLIEEFNWPRATRVAFKEKTPLREKFNDVLMRMREAGILDLWFRNLFKDSFHCIGRVGRNQNVMRAFNLTDLGGVFFILVGGLVLATLVFIGEVIIGKVKRNFSSNQ